MTAKKLSGVHGIEVRVERDDYDKIPAEYQPGGKFHRIYGYAWPGSTAAAEDVLLRRLCAKVKGLDNEDGTFVARGPRATARIVRIIESLGLRADLRPCRAGTGNHGGWSVAVGEKISESMLAQVAAAK